MRKRLREWSLGFAGFLFCSFRIQTKPCDSSPFSAFRWRTNSTWNMLSLPKHSVSSS